MPRFVKKHNNGHTIQEQHYIIFLYNFSCR